MKIMHCCLANFYIDNFGYQENILPKMHKIQGHDVEILASTETYIDSKIDYVDARRYLNEDGIIVTRIAYRKYIPKKINKKLRVYKDLMSNLKRFSPDIIFLHDLQFLSIISIAKYMKKNPKTKLIIDGHTDYVNSARNLISKNLLHKIIYRYCAKIIEPYTERFFGVLPLRVEFMKKVYKLPSKKVELLPLGYDDSVINVEERKQIREVTRTKLKISNDDFVIITGGKIDQRKQIHNLINAFREMNAENVKLVIFGEPTIEMREIINSLINFPNIHYLGWQQPYMINNLIISSDLAVYPGTHSVLWEQSVGLGIPTIFRRWNGIEHVDLGGNCLFIKSSDKKEIADAISEVLGDSELYNTMKKISRSKGKKVFAYSEIAKKSIRF